MIERPRESVPPQILCQWLLVLDEPRRRASSRKWRRKVEVKAGIDSLLTRDGCSPLGIRHEDHGTDGRDAAATNAVGGSLSSFPVPSPIVGIDDENTHVTAVSIGR